MISSICRDIARPATSITSRAMYAISFQACHYRPWIHRLACDTPYCVSQHPTYQCCTPKCRVVSLPTLDEPSSARWRTRCITPRPGNTTTKPSGTAGTHLQTSSSSRLLRCSSHTCFSRTTTTHRRTIFASGLLFGTLCGLSRSRELVLPTTITSTTHSLCKCGTGCVRHIDRLNHLRYSLKVKGRVRLDRISSRMPMIIPSTCIVSWG